MTQNDGWDQSVVSPVASAMMRPLPLLHGAAASELTSPTQLRQSMHDLSNNLTGLLGNLELVNMAAEDSELDRESLALAVESARSAVTAVRELKQQFDLRFPRESTHSSQP